ncbi:MAG: glycosyltransferase family 39 protein [Nitrospirae bacterium]|nr:glycosyltransferase family 39 protein [Nitrospirota bacterium]
MTQCCHQTGGKSKKTVAACYVAIIVFAAFMLLYNLQERLYWGDEAETALLAVNITKFGLPKSHDGKNAVAILGVNVESRNLVWTWRPWLDLYTAAASFTVFGKTTAAGRLPFALIGLASVVFIAWLANRIYSNHSTALLAALFIATNQAFVLHARQCRYYSIVIFAEILLIFGLLLLINGKLRQGVVYTAVSLVLQFYSNYIIVLGSVLSLGIFAVIARKQHENIIRPLLISFSIFFISTLPWLIYARPWGQVGRLAKEDTVEKLFNYLREINFHIFPFVLALIPVGYYLYRWITGPKSIPNATAQPVDTRLINLFLLIYIPCHLPAILISPGIYLRYIIVTIPVFCLLQAYIIVMYAKPPILRYTLVAVLCLTNYLSYYPAYFFRGFHQPEMPLITLVREISSEYSDALNDTVAFLKKEGLPDESILVKDPEFPLIFYTGMEVINYRHHAEALQGKLPDWIFPISISSVLNNTQLTIPDELMPLYEPVTVSIRNTRRGASMPEPDKHEPFSPTDKTDLVVYKKKSKLIRSLPQSQIPY